jgi:LmbE family N-acetylglucosaminyl deacetylase
MKKRITSSELAPFSLDGVQRLLVLAPHCDDETLGSGGLIQAAVRSGIEVRVVIATNGDGYPFATAGEFRKLHLTPKDFIHMGEVRQQESLTALARLGVTPDKVFFLSYPDRGTPMLFERYWSSANPYSSPYTGTWDSPYSLTFNPASVYAGEDYLADITSIVDDFHPDLLVYPDPQDVHPDHWGLSAFARLALTELCHRKPDYQPKQITYLVHRPDYPEPRGLSPSKALVPPAALYAINPVWLNWNLTPDQIKGKEQAVGKYKSQLPLLRGLMESFIRSNELFAPVVSVDMLTATTGKPLDPSTWMDSRGEPISPVQLDPTGDVVSHKASPATDLKAFHAARTPAGDLWLCAELNGNAAKNIPYTIRIKSLTETGITSFEAHSHPKPGRAVLHLSEKYFCVTTTLAELGNPWAIFIEATVESPDPLVPFDQTAWQMVYVRP